MRLWKKPDDKGPKPDPKQAYRDLASVVAQRPEVAALNSTLRRHRIENGFARKVFALAPKEGR